MKARKVLVVSTIVRAYQPHLIVAAPASPP